MAKKKKLKKKLLLAGKISVCLALSVLLIAYLYFEFKEMALPSGKGLGSTLFIYLATLLPFVGLVIWTVIKFGKSKTTWVVLVLFALSYLVRILLADFTSGDYNLYLSKWVNQYRSMPLKTCFIEQVGNYAPFYNYFLILFSRLPIYDLYLIKTLSFYFEVATAIMIMKLIAKAKQTPANPIHVAITLLLLIPLLNGSQWGQCDTIYTFFAVAGIYFAVNRKSIWCFVMMGIGFAVKLQMLFIYPVILLLLICRNSKGEKYLSWKHIWFTPLAFIAVNLLPLFFGGSLFKVIQVFIDQIFVGNPTQALCANCANIFLWLSKIDRSNILYPLLTFVSIGIVSLILTFIIISTYKMKKRSMEIIDVLFFTAFIPLLVVFFMPKMNDRYFYLAEIFMFIYMMVSNNDAKWLTCPAYISLEFGVLITYMAYLIHIKWVYWSANIFTCIAVLLMIIPFFLRNFCFITPDEPDIQATSDGKQNINS